jgi:hypothetical protein
VASYVHSRSRIRAFPLGALLLSTLMLLTGGPGAEAHDGGPGTDECTPEGRRDTYTSCE